MWCGSCCKLLAQWYGVNSQSDLTTVRPNSPFRQTTERVATAPMFMLRRLSLAVFLLRSKLSHPQATVSSNLIMFATASRPGHLTEAKKDHIDAFTQQICHVIVGKRESVKLAVACLLARGH